MFVADRLSVPEATRALLFDLDGVILDSLSLDYAIASGLLSAEAGRTVTVPESAIRRNFALSIDDFWTTIARECGVDLTGEQLARLTAEHDARRGAARLAVHDGVAEVVDGARALGMVVAVVSNNPVAEIRRTLDGTGIVPDIVVGNDEEGIRRKPAPDGYLAAAARAGVDPDRCVAIEDSLLGAEAASTAGCFTVAVATGADTFEALASSTFVRTTYTTLAPCHVLLGRKGVTVKSLASPNDFVSHMVEHIAWRLGCSIDLAWTNDDWPLLGRMLARQVRQFPLLRDAAATIGMIDDGSAEVRTAAAAGHGHLNLHASAQVDLAWFLGCRVEQLDNGTALVDVLRAFAQEAGLALDIRVSAFEDPHHTWEGIFRGVGITLDHLINERQPDPGPPADQGDPSDGAARPGGHERPVEQGWSVSGVTPWSASTTRETAESHVSVTVHAAQPAGANCAITVADSVHVSGMGELVDRFARAAGLRIDVRYLATQLSSSHVVTEDIGMTLGRALRLMAIERMEAFGIHGAGSSMTADSADERPVRVGVSMEGRKFWKYVPVEQDYPEFRRQFLIGHTLPSGMFSEDLDDFVDGLSGGLQASVIVHLDAAVRPEQGWPMLFEGLGTALAGLLAVNPHRRSLAPGVKATLA